MTAEISLTSTQTCALAGEYAAAVAVISCATSALQPNSSYLLTCSTMPYSRKRTASEEIKAKAAAAARRKRRRALVRRTHSPKTVRSSNHLSPGKRPAPTTEHGHESTDDETGQSNIQRVVVTIQPSLTGVQQEVPRRLLADETVAVPTECTYEACFRLAYKTPSTDDDVRGSVGSPFQVLEPVNAKARLRNNNGSLAVPHIYVPASLESPFLNKHFLQPRHYALRQGDKAAQICSFSETHQVLRRLAAKLWPGPCIVHLSVAAGQAAAPDLLHYRHHQAYIALRSPCHPLAVKVCQEYERCEDQNTEAHNKNTSIATVLVGRPLVGDTCEFVTTAGTAGTCGTRVDSVLNGEERREIFAVPTCEYKRPWPIQIWINSNERHIAIVHSSTTSTTTAAADTTLVLCNAATVLKSIQSRACGTSTRSKKTPKALFKERMVQAVLHKWKVVDEHA